MDRHIHLLLVEDNVADAELTRESMATSKVLHTLHAVADGRSALEFLRKEGKYANSPRPDIVLLDLNMPGIDGRQVLQEMKADPHLRRIPVVILTSSKAEEDVVRTYDLQASAYVIKPVDLSGFGKIVRAIESFWFSVVIFPPEE